MTIALKYTHLLASDVDTSIAFYRDVLGLAVATDVASSGFRWVTLTTDDQPGLEIVISEPGGGRSDEDATAIAALLAKGSMPMLVFSVSDLDATFAAAREAGAEIVQEPTDQPWGPRDAAVRDPSGTLVRLNQA